MKFIIIALFLAVMGCSAPAPEVDCGFDAVEDYNENGVRDIEDVVICVREFGPCRGITNGQEFLECSKENS